MNFNIKTGLTQKEVNISRQENGSNSLTNKKKNTFLKLLIDSLNDPIIKILLMALGVKVVFLFKSSDIYETVGIVAAILVASIISAVSEYGSEKAFDKLVEEENKMSVKVLRDKKIKEILIDDIVKYDTVYLESGDSVPCDGIVRDGNIYVDESSLTGETKEKYIDRGSKVYRGSTVSARKCIIEVLEVGDKTSYGKIAQSIQGESVVSPLKLKLRTLAKLISNIGYICAGCVMLSYLFNVIVMANNFNLNEIINMISSFEIMFPHILYALTLAVTIVVVAVPEGLPMMITLVLSSNMKRMLKNNVLVKKLVSIETAGSLNILFTDKTGTLTKGSLEVVEFLNPEGVSFKKLDDIKNKKFKEIVDLSLIYNNDSYFIDDKVSGGNTTDKAILKYTNNDKKSDFKIISKVLFDSNNKYSSVTLEYEMSTTFIKGAYEKLIEKCSYMYNNNGQKVQFKENKLLNNIIYKATSNGIRVIALCTSHNENMNSLCFVGCLFIKDELRDTTIDGVKLVQGASVNVVMLTGDSKNTASSIALETGIMNDYKNVVLSGEELSKLSDEEVKKLIPRLSVVARTLPHDKMRLINLSQELGLVVGMTGDGVNDAPALKKADVGFAMGSGTNVAKEVAGIVILDDNFLSISKTILFGRTIFKSIRKFIIFQLTVNLAAVSLSIIGPILGIVEPVSVVQMLWINMVMDTLAGIAFSYEPPLNEYMNEPPKKKNEHIVNKYMINQILVGGLYSSFLCLYFMKSSFIHELFRIDNNDKYLMTAFFGLFIFLAIFNAFNARTHRINLLSNLRKNKAFIVVILFIVIVQVLLIYFGGEIFRTTGLTVIEFYIMIFLSFTIIIVDEVRKLILRSLGSVRGV